MGGEAGTAPEGGKYDGMAMVHPQQTRTYSHEPPSASGACVALTAALWPPCACLMRWRRWGGGCTMKVSASEKSSRTLPGVLRFGVETPCAVLATQLAGVRTSGTSTLGTQTPIALHEERG
jgi:hypothetical protein